jgi:hypothetical protein
MKYHQKKTLILQCIDKLPNRLGYFIYHKLQHSTLKDIDGKLKAGRSSLKKIKEILDQYQIDLSHKDIIEIGSGWFPILPFLFKSEFNVNKIITYDINKHYSEQRVKLIKDYFKEFISSESSKDLSLPDFIMYHPKTNFINAKSIENVDFIYSRFVLEHVSPEDIYSMHKKIANDYPDKIKVLHLISPSDHRAYSDKSVSYYDFLKYSKDEWDKIQTKFDYHNRLRLPEYLYIFKKAGFKISHIEHDHVDKTSEKYKKFKALKLHSDYSKFSEKEILAGSICVLLQKDK